MVSAASTSRFETLTSSRKRESFQAMLAFSQSISSVSTLHVAQAGKDGAVLELLFGKT